LPPEQRELDTANRKHSSGRAPGMSSDKTDGNDHRKNAAEAE